MFIRRTNYHPYKRSAHTSPAGFRIAEHINPKRCFNLFQGPDFTNPSSPSPSPLSSPVRSPHHLQDDSPPTIRLADLFGGNGPESPQLPPNLMPGHLRGATPDDQETEAVPNSHPLPVPPRRRKDKYGPKHLSFNNGAPRPGPGLVPPRRRTQQLKEKQETARRRVPNRHKRRVARAREQISHLRKEAEVLMQPEHMNEDDKIFLKQLEALQLDQVLKHDLEQCRQRMSRAAEESPKRRQEHKERDELAAKMWEECQDEDARKEHKRKVEAFVRTKEERREARYRQMEETAMRADEERQHAHEALERTMREAQERHFREELARRAQEERRRQKEQERRIREERERQLREERERQRREERVRMLREEVERFRREAHAQFLREQRERHAREEREHLATEARERERQARLLAEQARRAAQEDQERQCFLLYEGKWDELRTNNALPPIDVPEIPWPVFGIVSSADQITFQDIRTFLFHPLRPGMEGRTKRDIVKSEVLRFHPDKFDKQVVPKIQPSQQALAQEIAGTVARILTSIMREEGQK